MTVPTLKSTIRTVIAACFGVVVSALYLFPLLLTMEFKAISMDHIEETVQPWVAGAKLTVLFVLVVAVVRMRGCSATRTLFFGTAMTLFAFEVLALSLEIEKHHISFPRPAREHDQERLWMMALTVGVIVAGIFHWCMRGVAPDRAGSMIHREV